MFERVSNTSMQIDLKKRFYEKDQKIIISFWYSLLLTYKRVEGKEINKLNIRFLNQ